MTDRSAPGSSAAAQKGRATAATTTVAPELDVQEEKVVRMRHGFALPAHLPLPQKAEGRPDVAAQLRAIELRAFELSGRYAELAAEAEADLEEEGGSEATAVKQKIIDRLKGPAQD